MKGLNKNKINCTAHTGPKKLLSYNFVENQYFFNTQTEEV